MMFSSATFLTSLLALTSCVVASPIELGKRGTSVQIGFRRADEAQAARYNAAGTLTDEMSTGGTQTGSAVYIANNRDGWLGRAGQWYCVIMADSDAMNRVSKAWIPQNWDGSRLWGASDQKMNTYIKSLEVSWDPAKTLRFSNINGVAGTQQIAIPSKLINSNGGAMGIFAKCFPNQGDVQDQTIDYTQWQDNSRGHA